MSISSVKTGAIGDSLLAGNSAYIPGDYVSISTVTVGAGGSSSITFSSIPSTYQHLQVRAIAKNNNTSGAGTNLNLTFNSDTGSNYAWHSVYGDGSTASYGAVTSTTSIFAGHSTNSTTSSPALANVFASTVLDVLDYGSTSKNKTIRALNGNDSNSTSGYIFFNSGLWLSTSAITSLTITSASGSFVQYSSFALYGLKG